jgi:cephalosporin hydroxylase
MEREVVAFHELYHEHRAQTWENTYWLGIRCSKLPFDLWVYQEILHERRPDLIIETGTAYGGSALFLASICDLLDHGRVVTIDVRELPRPQHPRVTYRLGNSADSDLAASIQVDDGERVMVVLDSDHSAEHVLAELHLYASLVTQGDYLIVEDTSVDGHPAFSDFGPGPMAAVEQFLAEGHPFEVDESREKFLFTFNPRGYLRKVS